MFEITRYIVVLWFDGMIELYDKIMKYCMIVMRSCGFILSCRMIWDIWNYDMWLSSVYLELLMFVL